MTELHKLETTFNVPLLNLMFDRYSGKAGQIGKVGVEIEAEFKNSNGFDHAFEESSLTRYWKTGVDNSLRNHGYEFVSPAFEGGPTDPQGSRLINAWASFFNSATCKNSLIVGAPRASIHVHVSAHGFTVNKILTVITAYTLVEGALVHFSGKSRIGNNFALRIPEACDNIRNLLGALKDQRIALPSEDQRYGALNLNALRKFGTFEFRMMGSNDYSPAHITRWFLALKNFVLHVSQYFVSPMDVIKNYSEIGPKAFIRSLFPDLAEELTRDKAVELAEEGEDPAIEIAQTIKESLIDTPDFRTHELYTTLRKIFWTTSSDFNSHDFIVGKRSFNNSLMSYERSQKDLKNGGTLKGKTGSSKRMVLNFIGEAVPIDWLEAIDRGEGFGDAPPPQLRPRR